MDSPAINADMAQYFDFGEAAVPELPQELDSLAIALSEGAAGAGLGDGASDECVSSFLTVSSITSMARPRCTTFLNLLHLFTSLSYLWCGRSLDIHSAASFERTFGFCLLHTHAIISTSIWTIMKNHNRIRF